MRLRLWSVVSAMVDAKAVGSIPTGRSITGGSFVSRKKTIYVIIMLFLGAGILFCAGAIKMGQMMDEENKQLYSGYTVPAEISGEEIDAEAEYLPVQVDWNSLRKKNNEVVGWVWVDADSEADIISYPVMYRAGDRDYYLSTILENNTASTEHRIFRATMTSMARSSRFTATISVLMLKQCSPHWSSIKKRTMLPATPLYGTPRWVRMSNHTRFFLS